jgi:2-hydroxymuconate-semialdehyde hydrolase
VGNSFGGALALALAARHPDRVNRMVLMGSAGIRFNLTWALDKVWGYAPSIAAMKELLEIFAYDKSKVNDDLAELRYRASVRPGVAEQFSDMFPEPRQRWLDGLALPEETIRAIDHEVLVIHGREDIVVPVTNAYRLHELLPNSQLHVFGRCGHWTQIEHCAAFNSLLLHFLAA